VETCTVPVHLHFAAWEIDVRVFGQPPGAEAPDGVKTRSAFVGAALAIGQIVNLD
jgi:hypothetical protein